MPRLGRAPLPHSAEQAQAFGLDRHPSLEDVGRRTLMWNPPLLEAYGGLTNYLRSSPCLPARDREIAILRHAWDCGSDYQWGMHAEMALNSGLTSEEIERIAGGPPDGDWARHEVAVMQAVDELHVASCVSDDTWIALSAHYDESQLIELLALVGSYRLLAYILNTVGIRPPTGRSPDLPGNSFLFTERP
jgi:alkylhydroperoxidase family enzyme